MDDEQGMMSGHLILAWKFWQPVWQGMAGASPEFALSEFAWPSHRHTTMSHKWDEEIICPEIVSLP
jgi:hypothetical protein